MNKEFRFSPDDWGFAPAINSACIELANDRLCHTVSISVTRPYFLEQAAELRAVRSAGLARTALHLDFSHIPNIKMLDKKIVAREVERQWEKYLQNDFILDSINGHRHSHTWPVVTSCIAEQMQKRSISLPIRWMNDRAHPASYLSAMAIRQVWKKFHWQPTGYLLKKDLESKSALRKKLIRFEEIICHPSHPTDFSQFEFKDSLRNQRVTEYQRLRKLLNEI